MTDAAPFTVAFDELALLVTRLEAVEKAQGEKSETRKVATGFFVSRGAKIFLVTNRHVVIDEPKAFFPDYLDLEIHLGNAKGSERRHHTLELYSRNETPVWKEHAFFGSNADIVVISLNGVLREDADRWTAFEEGGFATVIDVLPLGSDVILLGYPLGFYDTKNGLPIVRKGAVASMYQFPFAGNPYFLVDANLHEGMSGSPVVWPRRFLRMREGQVYLGNFDPVLLGVHSGEAIVGGKPTGLNAVWYPGLITEIIDGSAPQKNGPRTPSLGLHKGGTL